MSDQSTKEKILKIARVLFADNGFDGTSVRDIATAADVNVASVNYHFSSKENLFIEIISTGYKECSEEMRTFINKNNPSLEDALIHLFRHFMERSHDLVSSFKIIMSAQHNHQVMAGGTEDEMMGPPGGKAISEAIRKEAGDISEEDLHFALKVLFSHVTHQALLYHCSYRQSGSNIAFSTIPDIEKSICRLTAMVIQEVKSPS